jgi:hypothetical protein
MAYGISGGSDVIDSNKIFYYPTTLSADNLSTLNLHVNWSGSLFLGTAGTGVGYAGNGIDACKNAFSNFSFAKTSATPSHATFISFQYNGSEQGRISLNSGSTQYVTSSDYRIKENVSDLSSQWENIQSLNPVTFTKPYSETPNMVCSGFIAHELAEVYPTTVDGEKDAVDDYGQPILQGISKDMLTPFITKGLQETLEKIENLQSEVSDLFVRIEKLESE